MSRRDQEALPLPDLFADADPADAPAREPASAPADAEPAGADPADADPADAPAPPLATAGRPSARRTADEDLPAQWRLAEVQIANWGTLDGRVYRFPIARRGHLITGPSGSGKSSILDAIAAVLTPDHALRFNQAAQGGGKRDGQRNFVSYTRGAWSRAQDDTEDRVVSRYLRTGATWSGIILHYRHDAGRTVTLARLFFLRRTSMQRADLRDLCLLHPSAVNLTDLQEFVRGGIQTRRVQAAYPDGVVTSNFSHAKFYARMRSMLGIRSEAALLLLHRTQSAKNLDSLDQLFRQHMLDRPGTFDMADAAVEEFGALRVAYDRVVDLRRQRDHLLQLREAATDFERAEEDHAALSILLDAVPSFYDRLLLELYEKELRRCREDLQVRTAEADRAESQERQARDELDSARHVLASSGGDRILELERAIGDAEHKESEAARRHEAMAAKLSRAGMRSIPRTAQEYAQLQVEAHRVLATDPSTTGPSWEVQDAYAQARRHLADLDEQITALRRSRSSAPQALLAVRERLTDALGVPRSTLPFVSELLEVRESESAWTGAIERVLRPFALTLVVPAEHLASVAAWVDAHHLGTRLVYEEVAAGDPAVPPVRTEESLVHKLTVARGRFTAWVQARLADRYDYACVTDPAHLADHTRAVTLSGQVRSSATRYEKDDRYRIDDRSRWVLGDPQAKLEALIAQRTDAAEALEEAQAALDAAQRRRDQERDQREALADVLATPWSDLDAAAVGGEIASLRAQLDALAHKDLGVATAQAQFDSARTAHREAERLASDAREARVRADAELSGLIDRHQRSQQAAASRAGDAPQLDEEQTAELHRRFHVGRRSHTIESLTIASQSVSQHLRREVDQVKAASARAGERCAALASEFSHTWPSAAADATPRVEDRGAYLAVLDRIIAQGLPEHEQRFREMLRERSSIRIGELAAEIRSAPEEIRMRVEPVNESLTRSPFEEGRFLRLRVKNRHSETVQQFMRDLAEISAGSWAEESTQEAEQRYHRMAALMERLASSEHADRTWRAACLDTREHVTFLADEVDAAGAVHATYDSGAAMSGGQQQKLVIFCLAAALRYQLAGPDDLVPSYATVILDEAFDKADVRYTRMAMDVFLTFGFHLVLATPQKLVQTIAEYVGGITGVENPTRQRTVLTQVQWENDAVGER